MVKMQKFVTWIEIASIAYVKTDDFQKDIAEDVEIGFQTPNFEISRHYLKEKN